MIWVQKPQIFIIVALVGLVSLFWSKPAYSLNGIQLIGVGAIHRSLGGAGTAKPLDTTALLLNPAGLNRLGRRMDLNFTVGFPSSGMDSSAAAAGNAATANAQSQDEGALLPSLSLAYPLSNGRFTIGVGSFVAAGFGVDYSASRLSSALTGNAYDTSNRLTIIKMIPGFAYQIRDDLTIGVGVHINYAFFQGNNATAAAGFPATSGGNRFDPALGIGGSIGVIYEPLKWLAVGATYTSRQYFENLDRYIDLFPTGVDMPQQVSFGVALTAPDEHVLRGGLVLADFRWINWGDTGVLGTSPAAGGFGWPDQYIAHFGLQYELKPRLSVPITVRAGYNYGNSIITPGNAFANGLVPATTEHHLTSGASYQFTEKIAFHLSYTRYLKNTVTDDGSINPLGAGSQVSTGADVFSTQLELGF